MTIAIYPGTFDPITNGHLDIAIRAAEMFDKVIVAVPEKSSKNTMFSFCERVALLEAVFADVPRIQVHGYDGLTAAHAKFNGCSAMIRGLRATSDFEYEFQLAHINQHLAPWLDTVLLPARTDHTFISSTMIREMIRYGTDISPFVPPAVAAAVAAKQGA